ncbi:twin-arginine translocation signal domain-containing protein [Planctomycetota bacterium]
MKRRNFLKTLASAAAGLVTSLGMAGCMARVSEAAKDPEKGDPWRCQQCGYLTRTNEDISTHRCPRCTMKKLRRITEEEFQTWLNA